MPNLSDFKPETTFRALFVGRSGDGKSGAAASFPKPYHELDFDLRIAGIAGCTNWLSENDKISYQQFMPRSGWAPVDKHLTNLEFNAIAYRGNPALYQFPYKTIGLGSLTSLTRLLVSYSMQYTKGKTIGPEKAEDAIKLRIIGPSDINAESNGTLTVLDYIRSWPCNFIATAHIVDKWGKLESHEKEDNYKPQEVIGEKLSIRDNLGESVIALFDNVFRFSRREQGGKVIYEVEFAGDLAKNAFGILPGKYDITEKEFYPFFQNLIQKVKK